MVAHSFCLSCVLCTLCCQFLRIIHFCIAPSVFSDVYLTVLSIFHPSQTVSTLQFEKHASQKQVVSFTTIPPTLSLITACTCKVPITYLPASPARSVWTFGHCDFVTKMYFKVLFSCVLPNWKTICVWITLRCCELRYSRK